jgi:hypothetical protein
MKFPEEDIEILKKTLHSQSPELITGYKLKLNYKFGHFFQTSAKTLIPKSENSC